MVDHDGWYNPWDEFNKPDVREAYDAATSSGGFAYRTGVCYAAPGKVSFDPDGNIVIGKPSCRYVGDGLRIVSFAKT